MIKVGDMVEVTIDEDQIVFFGQPVPKYFKVEHFGGILYDGFHLYEEPHGVNKRRMKADNGKIIYFWIKLNNNHSPVFKDKIRKLSKKETDVLQVIHEI